MLLNGREFKFLKNYRNVYGKSSAKREYRDENVRGKRAVFFFIVLEKKIFLNLYPKRNDLVLILFLSF